MLPTDIYSQLIKELGLTREQAEGATGALLRLTRANVSQDEFQQVADSIPAVSDVMAKSPRFEIHRPPRIIAQISRMFGGLGALAPLARPLANLQIDKKTIPAIAKALSLCLEGNGSNNAKDILSKAWH